MVYVQVIGGLALLVFAGDQLVRGSVCMAQRLGISTLAIGLTVVAFGTSAPELMVSIDAVLTGAPTVALGNVVGSNIANTWLVIGAPAIFVPMYCTASKLSGNMIIMIMASVLFVGMAHFLGAFEATTGVIMLVLLALFLFYASRSKSKSDAYGEILADIETCGEESMSMKKAVVLTVSGLVGLAIGAHVLVLGAVGVAGELGVDEAIIGLTVVALGTSVPELVTATVAAFRGHCDVAIGNVVGSNIFNLMGVVGTASLFGTIPVTEGFLRFDLWIMIIAALSLLPFALFRIPIGRRLGLMFTGLYASYIFMLGKGVSSMDNLYSVGVTP
ncbi:MAG: calcium/sodium antiporter [Sphingomonadales bacterium]